MVASEDGRAAYCAVNSCLVLLPMAAGHEVYTVEGLAEGATLADAQQAMAAGGGSQCGYCTPGILVTARALLDRDPHPSRELIREAISGNLCRCTGYLQILEAIEAACQRSPAGPSTEEAP
jgi:carbon-monoxide dehydrogenase small subunit